MRQFSLESKSDAFFCVKEDLLNLYFFQHLAGQQKILLQLETGRRINDMDSESYTERKSDKSSLMEMDLKKLTDIESYVDEIFGK